MFPIRDSNPRGSTPLINYLLIAINLVVFFYEASLGDRGLQVFVERFGVVPAALLQGQHPGSWITPFTSMFMHGSWFHVLSNMWFLHIFGDNIEDKLGTLRYVLFYLVCGVAAALSQVAIQPLSQVPMVGASGAVAGILGGYVRLFPRAKILTLVPIFIFLQFMDISAWFFIFVWFGLQVVMGWSSLDLSGAQGGGVAFFAHIGGFVTGILCLGFFMRKQNQTAGWR